MANVFQGIFKEKFFIVLMLFLSIIFLFTLISHLFADYALTEKYLYSRSSFFQLSTEHAWMVFVSAVLSVFTGVSMGILVTREYWSDLLPVVNTAASVGQTFPPVAVLALAVPVVGFGTTPTIIALLLYGTFPIIRNTITGIESISNEVKEAAAGMGMTKLQILTKIELPVASNIILAGVRTSVIINIGTATIGATIGAGGFGAPIISGLINENFFYVFEGGLCVGLMAVAVDKAIECFQDKFFKYT